MLQLGYQIDWQRKEVHDGGVMGAEKKPAVTSSKTLSLAAASFRNRKDLKDVQQAVDE